MCGALETRAKGECSVRWALKRVALAERALPDIFRTKRMCAYSVAQTLSDGWPLASTSPRLKRGNVFSADCSRSGSLNGMVESVSSACATVGQSIIRSPSEVCISMVPARKESVRVSSNRR